MQVNVHEAKSQLSRLLGLVEEGGWWTPMSDNQAEDWIAGR